MGNEDNFVGPPHPTTPVESDPPTQGTRQSLDQQAKPYGNVRNKAPAQRHVLDELDDQGQVTISSR